MNPVRSKILALVLLIAASVGLPLQSRAAYNMFLSMTGITGGATNGSMGVLAWSMGLSNPGGRPDFQDLSFTKYMDVASPVLSFTCANNTTNTSAVLTIVNPATGNALYTVTLGNITISSVSNGGSSGETQFTENISLHYQSIVWTYQQLDASGNKVGSAITHSWNLITNTGS